MGAGLMRRGVIAVVAMGLCGSAAAFVRSTTPGGDELAWTTNCIDYFIHRDGSDDIPFDQVEAEVQRSFEQWELPDCSDVNFTYAGETAEKRAGYFQGEPNTNIIVWREGGGGIDDWEHDPAIIAVTTNTFCTETNRLCPFKGAILDADIEMNGERFRFTNNQIAAFSEFDLGNTLTHEIGHLIGLDHTPRRQATMFASAPPGELIKRDLAQDDIDGVCAIFPLRDSDEICYELAAGSGGGSAGSVSSCTACPGDRAGWAGLAALLIAGCLGRRRR